jgi:hypothetical protein
MLRGPLLIERLLLRRAASGKPAWFFRGENLEAF